MKTIWKLTIGYGLAGLALIILTFDIMHPYHRPIALTLYGISWLVFILSIWQSRSIKANYKRIIKPKLTAYLPHTLFALLLVLFAYVAWVLVPVTASPLTKMSKSDLEQEMKLDIQSCNKLQSNMQVYFQYMASNSLLNKDIASLSSQNKIHLQEQWYQFVTFYMELERLRDKYKGFYLLDYVTDPSLHANSFYISYNAFVMQYHYALKIKQFIKEPLLEKILNSSDKQHGLPENSFFDIMQRLTQSDELLRWQAGLAYLKLIKKDVSLSDARLDILESRSTVLFKELGKESELFIENPLNFFEKQARQTWLPIWKNTAIQISHLRTSKRDYFISADMLQAIKTRLQPCDIFLERRKWHLTNIGIPGFWPHNALYIGTPEEWDIYFDHLPKTSKKTPSQLIKEKFPEAFEHFSKKDEHGFPLAVIEARRPGVIFTALEDSAHADYLGVIRPVLSKADKFQALQNAFVHYGKPYDYDFDFITDDALVCSELISKAFEHKKELLLDPEMVNGRLILAPNTIAQRFDDGLTQVKPPFKFVLFLDSNETSKEVTERDVTVFRKSWQRLNWDILLD